MSSKVKYVGRYEAVRVPALGDNVWVELGQEVEVDDDELVASLLEQSDNWEAVAGVKPPKPEPVKRDDEEGKPE